MYSKFSIQNQNFEKKIKIKKKKKLKKKIARAS